MLSGCQREFKSHACSFAAREPWKAGHLNFQLLSLEVSSASHQVYEGDGLLRRLSGGESLLGE